MTSSIVSAILNKPNWHTKIHDQKICLNWTREFCEQGADYKIVSNIIGILRKHASYIHESNNNTFDIKLDDYYWFDNLNYSIGEIVEPNKCNCNCLVCTNQEYYIELPNNEIDSEVDEIINDPNLTDYRNCPCLKHVNMCKENFLHNNVWSFNNLIDVELKQKFINEVNKLDKSDKHPNTNNMVTNITHPSLYPYVKGMTLINDSKIKIGKSMIFQWLPANVKVEKIKTHKTNLNLHSDSDSDSNSNSESDSDYESDSSTITNENTQYKSTFMSSINGIPFDDSTVELYDTIGQIFSKFVPHFENIIENRYDYVPLRENCQVIVKIQEVNLDQNNQILDEGSWHLEGTKYERIVATGIYYYGMENIRDNYLNFRVNLADGTENGLSYHQYCFKYVEHHTGIVEQDGHNLNIGQIQTKEDLCLIWQNNLQHKVSDIVLEQINQSGTRKILVFFLVDTSERILSTADVVEPQSAYIDIETALINRQLLMFDRKYETKKQGGYYEREWSLCEH